MQRHRRRFLIIFILAFFTHVIRSFFKSYLVITTNTTVNNANAVSRWNETATTMKNPEGKGEEFYKSLSQTELDTHPQTSALTSCWLDIEKEFVPLFAEWHMQCKPIVYSIKIINEIFYVLIAVHHLLPPTKHRWIEGKYACNGVSDGSTLMPYEYNMVLECPRSINASKAVLESVSVTVPAYTARCNDRNGNLNKKIAAIDHNVDITYNTTLFDVCEREDIRHHEGLVINNGGRNSSISDHNVPKKGAHAVFMGDRQKAFEWAAYYHLIGFDHIWIYVNEDWNNGKGLVHKDYITWIPFNFKKIWLSNYNRTEISKGSKETFRIAGQNDGLWRAKRMRMDWFTAMDVDEYIHINHSNTKNTFNSSLEAFGKGLSASNIDTLPKLLDTFQERIGEKYAGIRMNSIFFGSGPTTNHTKNNLEIDYDWRQKGNPGVFHFERWKLLLNVTCNNYVAIHSQHTDKSCSGNTLWSSNANDLRFNHYKAPSNGVYWKFLKKVHSPDNVERDTSMVDEYREKILIEIRSDSTTGTYTKSSHQ